MSIPQTSIDQVNSDAFQNRLRDPNRNFFQRAQDATRQRLGMAPQPSPAGRTSLQQVDIDANVGGRVMRQQAGNPFGITQFPKVPGNNVYSNIVNTTADVLNNPITRSIPVIGQGATAIAMGAQAGLAMQGSGLPKSTSGRGAGRAAFIQADEVAPQPASTEKSTGYTRTPEDNKIIEEMRRRQDEAIKGYDTRTNANGVVQTGTDYKPFDKSDFDGEVSRLRASLGERISQNPMSTENDVALVKGTNVAGQFSSTRLPGTAESLFSDTPGEPDSGVNFYQEGLADSNFAESLGLKYPGVIKNAEKYDWEKSTLDVPFGTAIEFEAIETKPESYFKPGVVNSMTDRRLRELDQGLIRSGADYFAKGPDGQTMKVDTDLAKAVMLGAEGAREKLDSAIGGNTVNTTEETAFEVPDEPTFGGKVSPFSEQLYKDLEGINFQDLAENLEKSGYNPLGGMRPKLNYLELFQ